ncbi:hypothetical protein HUJ04_003112 [Dendroctonus ponderosae]|nr:hypothetical protein HUJ04_003112 [Dendroctonus ponderosae]KAH1023858.1 hypothetical protein HUJ05_003450 [Dendroctonus ponderosae]
MYQKDGQLDDLTLVGCPVQYFLNISPTSWLIKEGTKSPVILFIGFTLGDYVLVLCGNKKYLGVIKDIDRENE